MENYAAIDSSRNLQFDSRSASLLSLLYAAAIHIEELEWTGDNMIMFILSATLSLVTVLDRLFIIFCQHGSSGSAAIGENTVGGDVAHNPVYAC